MKNNKNDLFGIRKSFSNALSIFLRLADLPATNPDSFQRDSGMFFKSLQKKTLFIFMLMLLGFSAASANNISVANVSLTGRDIVNHFIDVKFDINWEDSWRTSSGPNNWDAAWVFVKYKVLGNYISSAGATAFGTTITVGSTTGLRVGMPVFITAGTGVFPDGTVVTSITNATTFEVSNAPYGYFSNETVVSGYEFWEHSTLNTSVYTEPSGSTITPASDGTGIFIYRSSDGTGTNTFSNAQLRWNYGVNGVADGASVDIDVFAIEMVYIPQGSFYAGDGTIISLSGQFNNYNSTSAFQITSESVPATLGGSDLGNMRNNNASVMHYTDDFNNSTTQLLPTAFPKGFAAFYCMKYEIMLQEYVDFLNTLTYTQQVTRTTSSPDANAGTGALIADNSYRNGIDIQTPGVYSNTPAVYACNLNGNGIYGESNDGQDIGCNYLSSMDLAAYLDWSGLRPMTELEYEKSCRGTLAPVPNEYAWGSTNVTAPSGIINSGSNNETTVLTSNANYYGGNAPLGPLRVGSFASSSSTRENAGATYYGIMEMSGNDLEFIVTVSRPEGRAFTGIHGDGLLDAAGNADVTFWPYGNFGFRGGFWGNYPQYMRVSDRYDAANNENDRNLSYGGRGVRTAP